MSNSIKFKKEVILDRRYNGSKEIRWKFNSTKYLPAGYAIKESYSWNCYDNDDNLLTHFDYYSRLRSKKSVIEWISNYDENYEYQLEKEKEQKLAEENEYLTQQMLENALTNSFKQYDDNSHILNINDVIEFQRSNLSKPCNIGEALMYGVKSSKGKIAKIIELNNNEYDKLVSSLTSAKREWFDSELGGHHSDDKRLLGYNFNEILNSNNLKNIWESTSYELLHVISSNNRKNLYVNNEGYDYIRYIGY